MKSLLLATVLVWNFCVWCVVGGSATFYLKEGGRGVWPSCTREIPCSSPGSILSSVDNTSTIYLMGGPTATFDWSTDILVTLTNLTNLVVRGAEPETEDDPENDGNATLVLPQQVTCEDYGKCCLTFRSLTLEGAMTVFPGALGIELSSSLASEEYQLFTLVGRSLVMGETASISVRETFFDFKTIDVLTADYSDGAYVPSRGYVFYCGKDSVCLFNGVGVGPVETLDLDGNLEPVNFSVLDGGLFQVGKFSSLQVKVVSVFNVTLTAPVVTLEDFATLSSRNLGLRLIDIWPRKIVTHLVKGGDSCATLFNLSVMTKTSSGLGFVEVGTLGALSVIRSKITHLDLSSTPLFSLGHSSQLVLTWTWWLHLTSTVPLATLQSTTTTGTPTSLYGSRIRMLNVDVGSEALFVSKNAEFRYLDLTSIVGSSFLEIASNTRPLVLHDAIFTDSNLDHIITTRGATTNGEAKVSVSQVAFHDGILTGDMFHSSSVLSIPGEITISSLDICNLTGAMGGDESFSPTECTCQGLTESYCRAKDMCGWIDGVCGVSFEGLPFLGKFQLQPEASTSSTMTLGPDGISSVCGELFVCGVCVAHDDCGWCTTTSSCMGSSQKASGCPARNPISSVLPSSGGEASPSAYTTLISDTFLESDCGEVCVHERVTGTQSPYTFMNQRKFNRNPRMRSTDPPLASLDDVSVTLESTTYEYKTLTLPYELRVGGIKTQVVSIHPSGIISFGDSSLIDHDDLLDILTPPEPLFSSTSLDYIPQPFYSGSTPRTFLSLYEGLDLDMSSISVKELESGEEGIGIALTFESSPPSSLSLDLQVQLLLSVPTSAAGTVTGEATVYDRIVIMGGTLIDIDGSVPDQAVSRFVSADPPEHVLLGSSPLQLLRKFSLFVNVGPTDLSSDESCTKYHSADNTSPGCEPGVLWDNCLVCGGDNRLCCNNHGVAISTTHTFFMPARSAAATVPEDPLSPWTGDPTLVTDASCICESTYCGDVCDKADLSGFKDAAEECAVIGPTLGESCSSDSDCGTVGFCVEGVCCGSNCSGCESCSATSHFILCESYTACTLDEPTTADQCVGDSNELASVGSLVGYCTADPEDPSLSQCKASISSGDTCPNSVACQVKDSSFHIFCPAECSSHDQCLDGLYCSGGKCGLSECTPLSLGDLSRTQCENLHACVGSEMAGSHYDSLVDPEYTCLLVECASDSDCVRAEASRAEGSISLLCGESGYCTANLTELITEVVNESTSNIDGESSGDSSFVGRISGALGTESSTAGLMGAAAVASIILVAFMAKKRHNKAPSLVTPVDDGGLSGAEMLLRRGDIGGSLEVEMGEKETEGINDLGGWGVPAHHPHHPPTARGHLGQQPPRTLRSLASALSAYDRDGPSTRRSLGAVSSRELTGEISARTRSLLFNEAPPSISSETLPGEAISSRGALVSSRGPGSAVAAGGALTPSAWDRWDSTNFRAELTVRDEFLSPGRPEAAASASDRTVISYDLGQPVDIPGPWGGGGGDLRSSISGILDVDAALAELGDLLSPTAKDALKSALAADDSSTAEKSAAKVKSLGNTVVVASLPHMSREASRRRSSGVGSSSSGSFKPLRPASPAFSRTPKSSGTPPPRSPLEDISFFKGGVVSPMMGGSASLKTSSGQRPPRPHHREDGLSDILSPTDSMASMGALDEGSPSMSGSPAIAALRNSLPMFTQTPPSHRTRVPSMESVSPTHSSGEVGTTSFANIPRVEEEAAASVIVLPHTEATQDPPMTSIVVPSSVVDFSGVNLPTGGNQTTSSGMALLPQHSFSSVGTSMSAAMPFSTSGAGASRNELFGFGIAPPAFAGFASGLAARDEDDQVKVVFGGRMVEGTSALPPPPESMTPLTTCSRTGTQFSPYASPSLQGGAPLFGVPCTRRGSGETVPSPALLGAVGLHDIWIPSTTTGGYPAGFNPGRRRSGDGTTLGIGAGGRMGRRSSAEGLGLGLSEFAASMTATARKGSATPRGPTASGFYQQMNALPSRGSNKVPVEWSPEDFVDATNDSTGSLASVAFVPVVSPPSTARLLGAPSTRPRLPTLPINSNDVASKRISAPGPGGPASPLTGASRASRRASGRNGAPHTSLSTARFFGPHFTIGGVNGVAGSPAGSPSITQRFSSPFTPPPAAASTSPSHSSIPDNSREGLKHSAGNPMNE